MDNYTLFPLTHAEKRIFITQKRYPQSPMWNLINSVRIGRAVYPVLLTKAIANITARHQSMRLHFIEEGGIPYQYDKKDLEPIVERLDFIGNGGENAYLQWLEDERNRPISIENAPTHLVVIATVTQNLAYLVVKLHHIAADGHSLAKITTEIVEEYESLLSDCSEKKKQVSEEGCFLDTVYIEADYLNSKQFKTDEDYWLNLFKIPPEPIELVPGSHETDFRAKSINLELDPDTNHRLISFCGKNRISPFRLFLAALYACLARRSGKTDIPIGSATFNRGEGKIDESVTGMFVSTIPFRIQCDLEAEFQALLGKVRTAVREALVHQQYPYDRMIASLRDSAEEITDLLTVSIVQFLRPDLPPDYSYTVLPPSESLAQFTIYLSYDTDNREDAQPITFHVTYSSSLMSSHEAHLLLNHVINIAVDGVSFPEKQLCWLAMLSEQEKELIVRGFNRGNKSYPSGLPINVWIERKAAENPDKKALVFKERVISYREMNFKANQLARRLQSEGVKRESVVGLWGERSLDLIVAQLAVLKAGGAFMPIDEKYPMERIQFMLEDSQAPVLLTQRNFSKDLKFQTKVLCLDDPEVFKGDGYNLGPVAREEDLAILIYTSGSTGKPKGVMIEHRSMSNFIFVCIDDFKLTESDSVAKHASFSFDASNLEIYPCLCAGGTLHIIPEELRLSLNALNEYYNQNNITFALFTTQLGEQFMESLDNKSLRTLIVGGEKLRKFKKRGYQLVNGYGPTETTVMATKYDVMKLEDNIPIGMPMTNYQILVLDRFDNLQPVGVPGELCVCGVSVARGYLNRPEKTAEAFGVNPLDPGEPMYRTNDLAYWRPDGNLVYLGRMDRQVKLRGYRVELGEIEQAMLAIPGISQAAVVDLKDASGRVFLCGYFVSGECKNETVLRSELGESLPSFMVPARMMRLETMPVTPNGKIDRKKLPVPEMDKPLHEVFVEPETDSEKRLASVWKSILKHDRIGRNDNFFSIGGDSLKSVQLQLEIEKEFSVSPSIADLFQASTLKDQGLLLDSMRPDERRIEIPPAPSADYYPITPSQKQLYILSRFKNAGIVYNIPFAVELIGKIDQKRLSDSILMMGRDYEILRSSFEVIDNKPVQRVHSDVYIKMEYAEASEASMDIVKREFVRPFNLSRPPLFRVKLVKLEDDRHILLFDIHHIISDGVSVGLFMERLSDIYNTGESRAPSIQFKDFAVWCNENFKNKEVLESGIFWEEIFADPPAVELPTDYPRPPQADFEGGVVEFVLDEEVTSRLKECARGCGSTLHHVLMAALAVLIGRYTEGEDIVLGTTTAGRFARGTENMMGMFVNTLPVRLSPGFNRTFSSLVNETRDVMLSILDHEAYPIDRLYQGLEINRGPGQHPLFDVNFVLQNMEKRSLELHGGVEVDLQMIYSNTAKFDLSFSAEEKKSLTEGGNSSVIRFHIEYRSALFNHDTVNRISGHFMRLASIVAAKPDLLLKDVEILHPDERNFLLHQVNDTMSSPPFWPTVSRIFERNAERFPSKTAIRAGEDRLTYKELNQKANAFADILIKRKFSKDTIIGVVADRSIEAVIGMMGALKAGAAYVGIDPGYPEERIEFILKDTGVPLVAGSGGALKSFPFQGEKIRLDTIPIGKETGNPADTPSTDSLSYIIFTSGSTGKPKGVMIEHGSMVNFIDWYCRFNAISEDENCAEFAAFSFDVSVVQVFAPLAAGATLHIIPEEMRRDPFELNRYFEINHITHAHLPTRFAEQFMRAVENQSLKRIVVGGDSLNSYKPSRYRLINEYGPSETCMASTAITVSKQYDRVPVGAPVANTRVYVLGKENFLRPQGFPGELCISGAGVARGYLNRPELTAEKFTQDPFVPGQRMYRTGDIARILPDGNVDFIGRKDFQVKIRGYRIEPGEIEKRISSYTGILNSVVVPVSSSMAGGDRSLCAYYEGSREITPEELRKFLSSQLPEYMVPSFFVQMVKLPINRNGKVDRRALPAPEIKFRDVGGKIMPSSEKEKRIAAVWEKVLGVGSIGVHDNFFEIGGDSLKAIVLMVELESILDISTNDVFAWPTVAQQAANIPEAADSLSARINGLKELVRQPDPSQEREIKSALISYRERIKRYDGVDLTKRRIYKNILLTGATGTLGVYLLKDLLEKTDSEITLIVRGKDDSHCLKRIEDHFFSTFEEGLFKRYISRLRVLKGNLSEFFLGLSEDIYHDMEGKIDCVIHSAANVRHAGEYQEFHNANVVSTENLLKMLANRKPAGDFHYISTTSVGAGRVPGKVAVFFSEEDLDVGQECENVYVRSKIAAENVVHKARKRGVNANIYRAGNITVDSSSGKFQKNIDDNAFYQQLKSYFNIGAVPTLMDKRNLSFVDCVSSAITTLFDLSELESETFHIENPHQVHISQMLTSPELGLNINKMDFDHFIDFFVKHYGRIGFAPYLERLMMHLGWVDFLNNGQGTVFVRPVDKTIKLLEKAGFIWPEPNPSHLAGLLEHACEDRLNFFKNIGMLKSLNRSQLLHICKKASMCLSDDGSLIFREHEKCDFTSFIVNGNVELNRTSINGWIGSIRIVGDKTPLGISNLSDDGPLPWNGEVVDELLWYKVGHNEIRTLLKESPLLALNIIEELQHSLTTLSRFIVALD